MTRLPSHAAYLGVAALGLLSACRERPAAPRPTSPPPAQVTHHPHGGLKPIGGIEGENPSYDRSRQPEKVVSALGLKPGQRVADVGAGRGYLTFRLADAVGASGRVVATDVDPDAIATLRERAAGRAGLEVRQVQPDDPGLEPATYDLILMSEVDHFLEDRVAFLTQVRRALAPGGRLAVTHVRALREPLEAAAREAGFSVVSSYDGLPAHYLLVFEPNRS